MKRVIFRFRSHDGETIHEAVFTDRRVSAGVCRRALRRRLESDPEGVADRLIAAGAKGSKCLGSSALQRTQLSPVFAAYAGWIAVRSTPPLCSPGAWPSATALSALSAGSSRDS
jgi:hypothetical protein